MHDLNDLAFFAAAAQHGGVGHASRELGVPEASIARAVAQLEALAGAPLVERATHLFAVTDAGQALLQHARPLLEQAQAAQALLTAHAADPRATVRVSCPPALLRHAVGPMIARCLRAWPQMRIHVSAINRNVDVNDGTVDLAVRVRAPGAPLPVDELVEPLAISPHLLACAPALLQGVAPPQGIADLAGLPTLGLGNSPEQSVWELSAPDGEVHEFTHEPRLVVDDMSALADAAEAGLGCAVLPSMLIQDALARGTLVRLLPDWAPPPGLVHAAFSAGSRRRPAVRHVLEALTLGFGGLIRDGVCRPPLE